MGVNTNFSLQLQNLVAAVSEKLQRQNGTTPSTSEVVKHLESMKTDGANSKLVQEAILLLRETASAGSTTILSRIRELPLAFKAVAATGVPVALTTPLFANHRSVEQPPPATDVYDLTTGQFSDSVIPYWSKHFLMATDSNAVTIENGALDSKQAEAVSSLVNTFNQSMPNGFRLLVVNNMSNDQMIEVFSRLKQELSETTAQNGNLMRANSSLCT